MMPRRAMTTARANWATSCSRASTQPSPFSGRKATRGDAGERAALPAARESSSGAESVQSPHSTRLSTQCCGAAEAASGSHGGDRVGCWSCGQDQHLLWPAAGATWPGGSSAGARTRPLVRGRHAGATHHFPMLWTWLFLQDRSDHAVPAALIGLLPRRACQHCPQQAAEPGPAPRGRARDSQVVPRAGWGLFRRESPQPRGSRGWGHWGAVAHRAAPLGGDLSRIRLGPGGCSRTRTFGPDVPRQWRELCVWHGRSPAGGRLKTAFTTCRGLPLPHRSRHRCFLTAGSPAPTRAYSASRTLMRDCSPCSARQHGCFFLAVRRRRSRHGAAKSRGEQSRTSVKESLESRSSHAAAQSKERLRLKVVQCRCSCSTLSVSCLLACRTRAPPHAGPTSVGSYA